MPYSDAELEELARGFESELVEFKASAADRSALRRNICAFANDLANRGRPGVIYVGLSADGLCARLPITDELLRQLAGLHREMVPVPTTFVERRTVRGCEVAVVTVEPSKNPPVRYEGRVWVKSGPTVRLATLEEERRLAERRRAGDLPYDHRPADSARLEDLDVDYIRTQYLPRAVAPDVLEQNQRSLEAQLVALKLTREGKPTWGGLLGFGRDPQAWLPGAYVQWVRFEGTDPSAPVRDRKELTGKLEDVLRRLDELFEVHVAFRSAPAAASVDFPHPDYPLVALQQLARNAVMHRTYEGTHAPIRVYWYSDRVEIQNPGGLYGQVNSENFGTGVTDYRNPLVAEIMHHLGFAQRFGIGLFLARKALQENGNPPPKFEFPGSHVAVTLLPAVVS